ncbi:FAD-dependent oxidoreductase [Ferrovibrio sp.]|uniref:FAD-dependent oxidoreductase n=1 Tax=Ferrovibrio sp. TaxID=1917215 RepID=UPI0035AF7BF0
MTTLEKLPVAIIGAGPIGLAAAAHLAERGLPFKVYEAGASVGANIRNWGHVRVFTTWEQNVDTASRRLLERHGWNVKRPDALPTGEEIVRDYLQPLADLPELKGQIETGARIVAISRAGLDKVTSKGRETKPFELRVETTTGKLRVDLARAVIDASGTWQNPNPLGASGLKIQGEAAFAERIAYGMPDVLGAGRAEYAGRRVAVVGGGYSAINVLLDLVRLAEAESATKAVWVVRGTNMDRIYGGGSADELEARGALGTRLKQLVDQGRIELITDFSATALREQAGGLQLVGTTSSGERALAPVDRIIVATGQRPDLEITRELRLELDPWLEGVKALGPLIDPNLHSCGSVPPHGHKETSHPEPGFYTIGVKSYGRAPTFLLLTGYEQARSVAAALAGDMKAADDVHLVLPETGICSTDSAADASGCCGGPAPLESNACCVADVVAKSAGKAGCGCGAVA